MGDLIPSDLNGQLKELGDKIKSLEDTKAKLTFMAWALGVLGVSLATFLVFLQIRVTDLHKRTSESEKAIENIDGNRKKALADIEVARGNVIRELEQDVTSQTRSAVPQLEAEINAVRRRADFIYSSAHLNGSSRLRRHVNLGKWDSSENIAALDATERWMYAIMNAAP